MTPLRIGIVDSGVNAWHSHVRGAVDGCALAVSPDGRIVEHDDFRDRSGHGTAVAGVIREGCADAHLYAVRVFDDAGAAYPSVVARGILRAAAEGCDYINLSVAIPPGPGSSALEAACAAGARSAHRTSSHGACRGSRRSIAGHGRSPRRRPLALPVPASLC